MSQEESSIRSLNDKLIDALERQADLEDRLALQQLQSRFKDTKIQTLEQYRQEKEDLIEQGKLFYRNDKGEEDVTQLRPPVLRQRSLDREVEELTGALFEEANNMVSEARKKTEEVRRRNEKLEEQLRNAESLLRDHQNQLTELKHVLAEVDSASMPSTPALTSRPSVESVGRAVESNRGMMQPSHPLAFPHLLKPVLSFDNAGFYEFLTFLRNAQTIIKGATGTGAVSGTPSHSPIVSSQAFFASASSSPVIGSGSGGSGGMQLKDSRFYKRVYVEDIEPTLRLDIATGLSWLARRNVTTSIMDGTLQIDPLSANALPAPCTICNATTSTHSFRSSDTGSVYRLCPACLARFRAVCDFVGFLRAVRDGGWKSEGDEGEKRAWEECTRLRERMFWSKVGGGVVPVVQDEAVEDSETLHQPDADEDSPRQREDDALSGSMASTNRTSDEINEAFEDAKDKFIA